MLLEVGDSRRKVGNHRHRVARVDEPILGNYHVTVSVAITGKTEVEAALLDAQNQVVGVDEVRVRVPTSKVRERDIIDDAGGG